MPRPRVLVALASVAFVVIAGVLVWVPPAPLTDAVCGGDEPSRFLPTSAGTWLCQRGCELGRGVSCTGRARLEPGAFLNDMERYEWRYRPKSVVWLDSGCKAGDGTACADLAMEYETGRFVPRNWTTKVALFDRSCELGSVDGCDVACTTHGWHQPELEPRMATRGCPLGAHLCCIALGRTPESAR